MKNKTKFYTELIITLIVASLLSWVVAFIVAFILGNLNMPSEEVLQYVNTAASTIWGLVVGYKLHSLLQEHRK